MWYTHYLITYLPRDMVYQPYELWHGQGFDILALCMCRNVVYRRVLSYVCWERLYHPCDKSFLTRDVVYQPCDKVSCLVFWYICRVTELHSQGCGIPTRFEQYNLLVQNIELFPILISLIPVVIYTHESQLKLTRNCICIQSWLSQLVEIANPLCECRN
jgi:hypothetical protein